MLVPLFPAVVFLAAAVTGMARPGLKTGDELLVEKFADLVKGKSVGLITNHSGLLPDGRHIADVLAALPGVKLVALFGPEHGIRGDVQDAQTIPDAVDDRTGVPVYSLYGEVTRPTGQMLKGIDVLVYDIQDVGTRFYTFISTLQLAMEAAAANHIKFIVLDRPDMLRADMVEGPVLDDSLSSFVGMQPIPSVYGMTPGEYAAMINGERLLEGGVTVDLAVIKMEGYKRDMWYDQTGLKWVKPSPNLPDMNAVEVYPGTVLFEGTNVSEGRGTDHPFEMIGAPYIDGTGLAGVMNRQRLPGVKFEAADFTPTPRPWVADPKYNGQLCHGIRIVVTDRNKFKPVATGIYLVWAVKRLSPEDFKFHGAEFDRLSGIPDIRLFLHAGVTPSEIIGKWNEALNKFRAVRGKYLLYP